MILTENGYSLSCTTCPKTGQPCSIGLQLARRLSAALRAGGSMIAEDFHVTGHGQIAGDCGQDCGVVYSLYNRGFRVFCGIAEDTDPDALARFADAFLGDGPIGFGPIPRAMIVGSEMTKADQQAVYA